MGGERNGNRENWAHLSGVVFGIQIHDQKRLSLFFMNPVSEETKSQAQAEPHPDKCVGDGMPNKRNTTIVVVTDEDIPCQMGGLIHVGDEEVPVFCVNEFSIRDANGTLYSAIQILGECVSLSDIANPRVPFEGKYELWGSVVCPFPQKTRGAVNPLIRQEATNESTSQQSHTNPNRKAPVTLTMEEKRAVRLSFPSDL